ncbi:type II secretion system F family protein [Actinomadura barringtoniae]|uniref:Type II secretion system F family protein n=1 Tax=Actinomadura barringtoniae TaxID=1427535 RepID=A0A939PNK4_9ACTN|nr:type II secretion system F family protein [Actinomadura barringtoniae]MBO2455525.1 type II secretion system F family protein [Actinomadura barringtoniae]
MIGPLGFAAVGIAVAIYFLAGPSLPAHRLAQLLHPHSTDHPNPLNQLATWLNNIRDRNRRELVWRTAVIELCDGMAAELAAGRTPDEAFAAAATFVDRTVAYELSAPDEQHPSSHIPSRAPEAAADTPAIERLEALAERPGAEGLRLLVACWRIGAERGGTLATVLDGLASALRDEETQRQEVAAQLAGPKATARLLAGLPLLGLGMAAALGANPLAFLFGTLPGLGCLLTGLALDATGLWWTRRLARAAEVPR